jgi:hypothetical protein
MAVVQGSQRIRRHNRDIGMTVDLRASEPDGLHHAGAQIGPYEP